MGGIPASRYGLRISFSFRFLFGPALNLVRMCLTFAIKDSAFLSLINAPASWWRPKGSMIANDDTRHLDRYANDNATEGRH